MCLRYLDDADPLTDDASNDFGLVGLGVGELCADRFHPNYDGAPQDGRAWEPEIEGPRVVRGGGAALSPWQSVGEWQMLLSAWRRAFSGRSRDATLAVRLVCSLPVGS